MKRGIPNGIQSIWFNYLSVELSKMLVMELQRVNLIEIIVQERFPDLLALAKSRIEPVINLAQLDELFLAVLRARTAEEIEQILSNFQ